MYNYVMMMRYIKWMGLLLFITCILILSSCAPDIVREGGAVVHGQPQNSADFLSYYADETIVYVTKSGEKYHTADCSYLTDSAIPVSLEQAVAEGKTPCKRCHPLGG